MSIDDFNKVARYRLESGEMTDEEWEDVLGALLCAYESSGMGEFGHTLECMLADVYETMPEWPSPNA